MVLGAFLGGVIRVATSLGSQAKQLFGTASKSGFDAKTVTETVARSVLPYDIKDIKRTAGNALMQQMGVGSDIFKVKGALNKVKQESVSIGAKEHNIEVQCTDRKTGQVRTHNYLVLGRDLAGFLHNIQKSIRDAGDEGCSGDPESDVGINVSVS